MSGSAPPLWNPSGMRMNSEPPSQLRPPNADQYNNNPHSRNPTAQGGGQDDTWGWGWDDDTQAQDENDWGGPGWQKVDDGPTAQPAAPPPHPHPVGSIQRPITHHYPPANVAPPTKPVNSSDFFENVDLAGKNFYPSDNNNKFQDRFSNSPALSDHFQEHHNQYPHHQPPSNNTMQQVSLRGKEEEVQQQQQQQLQQQQGYSYFQFSPADNQTKLNELNDVLKPIPDLFGPPSAAPPHQGHAYNNLQPTQTTLNNSYSGMYNNYQHQNDNNSGFPDAKSSISSGPPTANAYYQPQKQIYGDQMQNYGDREQDYGDRKQDYGDQKQNYGDQMQNYSDHKQNYGDQMQNYSDHKQNYGDQMQNYGDQYGVQQQKTQGQQMMYPYSNSNVGVDSYATGYPNGAIQPPVTSSSSFSDSSLAPAPAAAAAAAAAATTAEVENVEVAPPEQPQKVSATNKSTSATSQQFAGGRLSGNSSFPDNQETVIPDNEERPSSHDADLLSSQMNSLRLNATTAAQQVASVPRQMPPVSSVESSSLDQWNAVPGWENQEVAPSPSPVSAGRAQTKRFTVDRNQYLETGHLSSNPGQITALDNDVDTNDEGEAAPPPGLHRLVTGQVTPGEVDHSDAVGVASVTSQQRMVVGSGQEPSLATRLVPGQGQSAAAGGGDQANLDGGGTQPPATAAPPQSSQSWRMSAQGDRPQQRLVPGQGDMNEVRLVAGQVDDQPPPLGQRLVPGQPSDDEVTGGGAGGVGAVPPPDSSSASTASSAASRGEVPGGSGLRGEVDGGGGDDDGDDDEESERRVPGMQQQQQMPGDGQDSEAIAAAGTSISVGASISAPGDASQRKANEQPPPAMQRFVLGHNNSAAEDRSRGGPLSGDEADAGSMGGPSGAGGNIPPPGFHRMVVGELRGKEKDVDRSRDKDTDAEDREKDRDTEYSDSDYRMNRSRKSRQRRDSYDDDRDSRASPSDRERSDRHAHHYQDYWDRHWESGGGGGSPKMAPSGGGSRNKHRSQRRSADRHSYDHSPEYRSEDDYEHRDRHDYRDHRRDRDRDRDRGDNDRDRRRRSPRPYRDDYYPYREDVDYRDDPRRRRSDRRMHYDSVYRGGEDYYSRENRSRPTSRSGSDYRRQGAPRDFVPTPRHHSSAYYPDPGAVNPYQYYYQMQQYYEDMRRNDPQRYASWYEQYMSGKLQYGQMPAGGAGPGSGVGVSNAATAANSSYDTDRASVHSGRSSAQAHRSQTDRSMNDISKTGDDDYGEEEEVESQRNTPLLFMGAHTKAHFGRQNQLAVVWPHYLLAGIDGGQPATATVSLLQLAAAAPSATAVADSDVAELLECPGPFTAGVTHKSTVVQYLKRRSEMSTRSSERLLYDLILLVVRLNGVVDKNDVAELLLSSYKEKKAMQQQQQQTAEEELASLNQQQQEVQGWSMDGNLASAPTPPPTLPQHEVVAKFRDLLLEGNKSDALEWAIQNKIWGHAFFLAYKMDARTYNNVILRFANGLAVNDPLQTLYQTMSGREPQAATCAADKKWGDWRTHLAMMLSNPSGNADLDRKSVITLGDSLANRGRLFAAHFCYLTAQVKFSDYTDRSAKLVLLGSSHHLPFNKFATCRAIMLSLCYEYAMRLNKKDFIMPALQTYKYLLAVRLAECNKLSAALQHLEYLAIDLTNLPTADSRQLAIRVAELADQLKLADPSLSLMADPDEDPDWLAGLKQMLDDISDANLQTSNMSRAISTSTVSTSGADLNPNQQGMDVPLYGDSTNVHSWSSQQQQQTPMTYDPSQADNTGMLNPNSVPMVSNLQQPYQQSQFQPDYSVPPTYGIDQPVSSIPQQQNQQQSWDPTAANSWQHQHMYQDQQQQQQQYAMQEQQQLNQHQPADHTYSNSGITLSSGPSSYYSGTSQQQNQQPSQPSNDNKEAKPQSTEKSSSRKSNKKAKEASNSTGWFGGIWSTFSLKPKNQMKLPDDKNPSIIWDDKLGKWVNTDGDEEDEAEKLKPPPKAADIPGFRPANMVAPADGGLQHPSAGLPTMQPVPSAVAAPAAVPTLATGLISQPLQPLSNNASSAVTNAAPAATGPPSVNMYKMKRGKGVKSNYVNVLDSIKNSHQPPGPDLMMATGPSSLPPPANNFFIPAPMEGNENAPIDFLTPSGPVSYESTSQSKGLDQQQPAEPNAGVGGEGEIDPKTANNINHHDNMSSSSASSLSREVSSIMMKNHKPSFPTRRLPAL